jgi:acetyl esterase/lipase
MEKAVVEAELTSANTLQPTATARLLGLVGKSILYPTLGLAQPLFMATGERDVDVSAEQQLALARDACAAGTHLLQHVYPGLDHSGTVNASLVDSIPFVRRALAGDVTDLSCAVTSR